MMMMMMQLKKESQERHATWESISKSQKLKHYIEVKRRMFYKCHVPFEHDRCIHGMVLFCMHDNDACIVLPLPCRDGLTPNFTSTDVSPQLQSLLSAFCFSCQMLDRILNPVTFNWQALSIYWKENTS